MRGGGRRLADSVPDEVISRAQAQRLVRRLWSMLDDYYVRIFVAVFLLMLQVGTLLAGPALVAYGIDHGIKGRSGAALDRAALVYVVLALIAFVLGRTVTVLVAKIGEGYLQDLRGTVFRHLMSLSLGFFEREQTGRLVARMTSDIDALEDLVSQGLVLMVQNVLLFLGAVLAIFLLSWRLALAVFVIVPPVFMASRWFRRVSNVAYREVRDSIATNMSTLQEGLEGIRVVQAYAREPSFRDRFHGTNEGQYDANLVAVRISSLYFPSVEFTSVLGYAVILGFGGLLVHDGFTTVGVVTAFVLYLVNLFDPINQLSQFYNTVQSAAAALDKVFILLDTRPTVAERVGAFDVPSVEGDGRGIGVDVDHVSFAYGPDADLVLHDVTLHIAPGERMALVGPTGAGKSTLAKLLARFYDPVEGTVQVGGADLRDITFASLRRTMCVVPQEGYLFAGSLRDNIRVGRVDATDADVDAAIAALGVGHHFDSFPDGLDTEVQEGGSRLSAGERQIVSLARAALADPGVLVLDEATSNLDPGTEHEVEQALERLMSGRTVVVVAHRLSTAARADRIAVIDAGGLAELGTHDELVARGGRYASLYAAWQTHHQDAA
ncbi:MAG TPA: ABC transporter ATP-binding protein [Acidimicrobiia bacterium]|jgi:ATP-binding cassette subfamily B protein